MYTRIQCDSSQINQQHALINFSFSVKIEEAIKIHGYRAAWNKWRYQKLCYRSRLVFGCESICDCVLQNYTILRRFSVYFISYKDIFGRLVLIEVVCHNADVDLNPAWSMWDYLWLRDIAFFPPKCFYFIVYQCSILEILMYNLCMWQHRSMKTSLTWIWSIRK